MLSVDCQMCELPLYLALTRAEFDPHCRDDRSSDIEPLMNPNRAPEDMDDRLPVNGRSNKNGRKLIPPLVLSLLIVFIITICTWL